MKKNILGFAVFSLIVVSAAFVYKNFNRTKVKTGSGFAESTRCGEAIAQPETSAPFVSQAVLDVKKQMLYWQLSEPNSRKSVKLNFFVKTLNGTRYVVSSPLVRSGLQSGEFAFERRLIEKLHRDENLYVEAVSVSELHENAAEPNCAGGKAAPVSIFREK